jgi:AraC-like DNA-binding protein
MLNLYLAPSLCVALPRSPTAFPASALLIELIRALSRASDLTQPDYCRSLAHMVSMEMLRLHNVNPEDIMRPQPKQAHLKEIAEALANNPSDGRGLSEWARAFGKSPKTLAREINRDIGITFREWQLVCKMLEARERLRAGESVKSISFGLGYSNPNTMVASFRRLFGITPGSLKRR